MCDNKNMDKSIVLHIPY